MSKTALIFLICLSSAQVARAGQYLQSAFRAEGYSEKTETPDHTVSIKADVAEGLNQLNMKTLYDSQIEIFTKNETVKMTAGEALFKPDEILLKGSAKLTVLSKKGAEFFAVSSVGPEDLVYYNVAEKQITAPAAKLVLGKKSYEGRALAVNLQKKRIIWVQSVTEDGKKLKSPLELKF